MKRFKIITLSVALLSFLGGAIAQDDFYPSSKNKSNKDVEVTKSVEDDFSEDEYSTATDYYIDNRVAEKQVAYDTRMGITDSTTYYQDENGNTQITNNYYGGDNYDFDNEYYDKEQQLFYDYRVVR